MSSLPTSTMDHTLSLLLKLKLKLDSIMLLKPDGQWTKPSLMISLPTTTIPLIKEDNSSQMSKPTLSKRKLSTNNMLLLGTTRWRTSTSRTLTVDGLSVLITKIPLLINGLMLKLMILLPEKSSSQTLLTIKTPSLPRKLLSKPPLKLNGQRNSRHTKPPSLISTRLSEDHKKELLKELLCNHTL